MIRVSNNLERSHKKMIGQDDSSDNGVGDTTHKVSQHVKGRCCCAVQCFFDVCNLL